MVGSTAPQKWPPEALSFWKPTGTDGSAAPARGALEGEAREASVIETPKNPILSCSKPRAKRPPEMVLSLNRWNVQQILKVAKRWQQQDCTQDSHQGSGEMNSLPQFQIPSCYQLEFLLSASFIDPSFHTVTANCWRLVEEVAPFLLSLSRKGKNQKGVAQFFNLEKISNGLRVTVLVPKVKCTATGGHCDRVEKCYSRGFRAAL